MSEHSVKGKIHVKDYMYLNGLKPHMVVITQALRKSYAQARGRYHEYLEEEKEKQKTSKETAKEISSFGN